MVLADAAAWLAKTNRKAEAAPLVAEAMALAERIQDWPRDHVKMHAAQALAALGREEEVAELRRFYGSNRDYQGWLAAYHALGLLTSGRTNDAVETLVNLPDTNSFDTAAWRTVGYRMLAESGLLRGEALTNALTLGWGAAGVVGGNRQWELQLEAVDAAMKAGAADLAGARLETVTSNILAAAGPLSGYLTAPAIAQASLRWARAGRADRLAQLHAVGIERMRADTETIEHPAIIAVFAEAFAAAGDRPRALAGFVEALNVAAGLTNLRPRAMACVDVCLALARAGIRDAAIDEGIARAAATFHAARD
jgi:hypothetical protein